MAGGLFRAPKRTLAAVHGRRSHTTYGDELEALLEERVGDLRRRYLPAGELRASGVDLALFVIAVGTGFVVGGYENATPC